MMRIKGRLIIFAGGGARLRGIRRDVSLDDFASEDEEVVGGVLDLQLHLHARRRVGYNSE